MNELRASTSPDERMTAARKLYERNAAGAGADVDVEAMWSYRLGRVREQIQKEDFACMVLYDPVNIRYATGTSTMPVFSLHFRDRYCFIPADGPVVFFEKPHWRHLTEGSGTVDEVRTQVSCRGATGGPNVTKNVVKWISEIDELIGNFGGGSRRIAMDHCEPVLALALAEKGFELCEAQEPLERARAIKSADEIQCMRIALAVAEHGMHKMREALKPGITENELWAILARTNIAYGGEWLECRLLAAGQRTNPWLQEATDRPVRAGELVAFDTDMIGPFGYCADISRTYFCGSDRPTRRQRELYRLAHEELHHNMSLLRAGVTLREVAEQAWKVPAQYADNSYAFIAHGVGLCDEWPNCYQLERLEAQDEGGIVLESGMTLCVESYIGESGGPDGVKLEEQVLIAEEGAERLSSFPFEEDLLAAE
ncbi:MAG: M24 family metallopeptidase [Gammaproteobacteria bacterium]